MQDLNIKLKLDIKPYTESIKSALRIAKEFNTQADKLLSLKSPRVSMSKIDSEMKGLEKRLTNIGTASTQGIGKLNKDLVTANELTPKLNTNTNSLLGNLGMVKIAALAAGTAILGMLASGIKSYIEATFHVDKLRQGLDNISASGSIDYFVAQADRLEKAVGIFSAEEIMEAQTQLTTFQMWGGAIDQLIPRIINMASSLKIAGKEGANLQQLSITIGKAFVDGIGPLKRYGVTFTDLQERQFAAGDSTEKLAILIEALDANFNDFRQTIGNTELGKIERIKRSWEELLEKFGKGFVEQAASEFSILNSEVDKTQEGISGAAVAAEYLSRGFVLMITYTTPIGAVAKSFEFLANLIEHADSKIKEFNSEIDWMIGMLNTTPQGTLFAAILDWITSARKEMKDFNDELENLGNVKLPTGKGGDVPGIYDLGGIAAPGSLDTSTKKTGSRKNRGKSGPKQKEILTDLDRLKQSLTEALTVLALVDAQSGATSTAWQQQSEKVEKLREDIEKLERQYIKFNNTISQTQLESLSEKITTPLQALMGVRKRASVPDPSQKPEDKPLDLDAIFSETLSLADQLISILNIGADTFVAKLINGLRAAIDIATSIFRLILLFSGNVSTGGIFSLLGSLPGGSAGGAIAGMPPAGPSGIAGITGRYMQAASISPAAMSSSGTTKIQVTGKFVQRGKDLHAVVTNRENDIFNTAL